MLIAVSLAIRLIRLCRQLLLAYYIGVSGAVDRLLVAQMLPLIIVAMFGGSAGEIVVSLRQAGGNVSDRVIAVFAALVLGIGLVLSVGGAVALPWFAWMYGIEPGDYAAFRALSLILLANVLPAMVVSIGTFLAFMHDRYRDYAIVTVSSELIGLLTIVVAVPMFQITAFALATLAVSLTNAALLWRVVGPDREAIRALRSRSAWRELGPLWNRLRLVSGQVGVSYIGAFVERAMCIRVLADGYLSALGYSQSIFEIPNTMIAGSIGTTTYVRQTEHGSADRIEFLRYTRKMFSAMFFIGCVAQVLFVAGLPLLLIALFRRGRFDNAAVGSTMVVGEIIGTGLLAAILSSFWERTLYSFGEFGVVFRTVVLRAWVKALMIAGGIFWFPQVVPIAGATAFGVSAVATGVMASRRLQMSMFTVKHTTALFAVVALNIVCIAANHRLLPWYMQLPNLTVFMVGGAALVASGAAVWWMTTLRRRTFVTGAVVAAERLGS